MIRNANSAVERVRNQLFYKLGQAMIASSKAAGGGGGGDIIPHNLFI